MMKLRQLFVVGALGASLGLVFAQTWCVWDNETFPGSYGCTNEDCGIGCGAPYDFASHKKCKAGLDAVGCCECSWDTWTCDFWPTGTCHGSSSSRLSNMDWVCPESAAACIRQGGGGDPG